MTILTCLASHSKINIYNSVLVCKFLIRAHLGYNCRFVLWYRYLNMRSLNHEVKTYYVWQCKLFWTSIKGNRFRHHTVIALNHIKRTHLRTWINIFHIYTQRSSVYWLISNVWFWFWFWRYLTRGLIWYWSQSSIRPSIYFSSMVKSCSNPFLKPTSTKQ